MFDLAIIIINFNTPQLTIKCLKSIISSNLKLTYKIWLVDNGSTDDSIRIIKNLTSKIQNLKFIANKGNLGFALGNNRALREAYKQAKYCLLLNSDTEVQKDSLFNLHSFAEKSGFDIVSCRLINLDGTFQPNIGSLPTPIAVFMWLSGLDDIFRKLVHLPSYQERAENYYVNGKEVGWASGSVMLINSNVIRKIGFFDEKIFMYGEDVDFCWRAKKNGYRIGWTNSANIKHKGGASSNKPQFAQWLGEFKGLLYLYKKHYNKFSRNLLKILMYFFILLRSIIFFCLGKGDYAKTYADIITKI